jgi:hypothetical protein
MSCSELSVTELETDSCLQHHTHCVIDNERWGRINLASSFRQVSRASQLSEVSFTGQQTCLWPCVGHFGVITSLFWIELHQWFQPRITLVSSKELLAKWIPRPHLRQTKQKSPEAVPWHKYFKALQVIPLCRWGWVIKASSKEDTADQNYTYV